MPNWREKLFIAASPASLRMGGEAEVEGDEGEVLSRRERITDEW
jgi:hypothetical protein